MPIARSRHGLILYSVFTSLLIALTALKYYNLNTTYLDLGAFLNNFSQIAEGQVQRVFVSHSQPYGLIWAQAYNLFPSEIAPYAILFFQSIFIALPIIGLYHYYGWLPAIAFCLYFPVWYNALFDFHFDHLAIPFLFAFFFLEKQGKIWWAVVAAIGLMFVKEVFALQALFAGLYLLLAKKRPCAGIVLASFAIFYFFGTTQFLLKYFNSQYIHINAGWDIISSSNSPFGWMGSNLTEIIEFVLTHPFKVFQNIIETKGKLLFILYILGSLGFIPLLRPGIFLVSIPILGSTLLSNIPSHYGYPHHYTAGLVAPMIIGFAEGLPKAKELWQRARLNPEWFVPLTVAGLFLCHFLLSPSPISRKFYTHKAWFYHYSVYIPLDRNIIIESAVKRLVPTDPNITVSIQNTLNLNYLTQRKTIFVFPHGATAKSSIFDSSKRNWSGFLEFVKSGDLNLPFIEKKWADYVVLDLKRPWFIVDQGCHWIMGKCQGDADFETAFLELVDKTNHQFDTVFKKDGMMILKLKSGTDH